MKDMLKAIITVVMTVSSSLSVQAVTSPNGKFSLWESNGNLVLTSVDKNGFVSMLSLFCGNVKAIDGVRTTSVSYDMLTGKRKHCSNSYAEQKYMLTDGDTLFVRLYNDGMAWKRTGTSRIVFLNVAHNWIQEWSGGYEGFFPKDRKIIAGNRYGYPALVEFDNGSFGLLTESGITSDGAGVSMHAHGGNLFDLIPDGSENGGWQTFIAGSLAEVVESTLVSDNSQEAVITDTSWIEPGVAAWVYWAYNHGSNDFNIISRYVDLATELKLPYVLIDAEWDEMKDGKTVEDAIAYSIDKGVKPLIWYNSSVGWVNGAPGPKFRLNTPESLEKEFAWCEKIGVSGVKIDFFSGDTNLNIKFMSELLEAAARHHLIVNFHGAPLPRGWQRTYPNLITTEAVYGAEWYNNVPTFTNKAATHNATLPFTRNVIGSMDYTPCAFSDSQHPHITTHAHELALTALFESGIQHLADRPESLLAQPQEVKNYFTNLPAAWDETIFLGGYPGDYVALARKKGNKWWIAAINGSDEMLKGVTLDYSRLKLSQSSVIGILFEDAVPGSEKFWQITEKTVLPQTIDLLPRGGFVIVVEAK